MTRDEAIQLFKEMESKEMYWQLQELCDLAIEALSADAPTIEPSEQVTSKLKNHCDSLLTEDSEDSKEQKSKLDHDREWIIGCIKHDGFIKTDRFDKANQIILEALEKHQLSGETSTFKVDTPTDLISRAETKEALNTAILNHIVTNTLYNTINAVIDGMPSVSAEPTTRERKETKSTLLTLKHLFEDEEILKALDVAIECVSADPKRGEWINAWVDPKREDSLVFMCSECKGHSVARFDFCPNCGAKMGVSE